jgi:small-conductance mechanosensitive channel
MAIRFRAWLNALMLLLVVEFGLGLWLSRYGTFPATRNVAKTLEYRGDPVLSAHIALAVLVVLLAFVIAASAFGPGAPARLRWFTLGGFLALFGAYESGVEFIMSGFANDLYTITMLVSFLAAMAFFGLAQRELRLSGASPPAPTPPAPAT